MSSPSLADITTSILVVCAITVTGLLVNLELFPTEAVRAVPAPDVVEDWEQYAVPANTIGPGDARVTIVEFRDY